jgi:hypothetical protein
LSQQIVKELCSSALICSWVSITPFCNCVKLFFCVVVKIQLAPLLAKRCLLQFHKYNIFCENVNLCFYNPTACRVLFLLHWLLTTQHLHLHRVQVMFVQCRY